MTFPKIPISERDKKILLIGVIFSAFVLLIMLGEWLLNDIASLQQQNTLNHKLLAWMQSADRQLQQNGQTLKEGTSHGTLPANIQSALTQAGLATHVIQLRQSENGAVQLSLKQVDFDQLSQLLNQFQQKFGATVMQIHITRVSDTGSVNADMLLQE